ncbi:hypothetical protein Pa4123_50550 [Phytohabitans aurantiacus]|uniref:Uncharacterized protein n=1 Tax=Phytohabitans aurantiacus TaxID=3016789 RepID=A0ABQ5R1G2_9ACTN|nr:hypothetical protein Pa4123_50550 [Phytohabitans aurantiacus]
MAEVRVGRDAREARHCPAAADPVDGRRDRIPACRADAVDDEDAGGAEIVEGGPEPGGGTPPGEGAGVARQR